MTDSCPRITVLVAFGPSQLSKNYESLHGGYRHKTISCLAGQKLIPRKQAPTSLLKTTNILGEGEDECFIKTKSQAPSKKKEFKTSQTLKAYLISARVVPNDVSGQEEAARGPGRDALGVFFRWKGRGFWWMKTIEFYLNSSMVSCFDTQLLTE